MYNTGVKGFTITLGLQVLTIWFITFLLGKVIVIGDPLLILLFLACEFLCVRAFYSCLS